MSTIFVVGSFIYYSVLKTPSDGTEMNCARLKYFLKYSKLRSVTSKARRGKQRKQPLRVCPDGQDSLVPAAPTMGVNQP